MAEKPVNVIAYRKSRRYQVKKSPDEPPIDTLAYAGSLTGLGINLLVRDVSRHAVFVREVLGIEVVYGDADIAIYRHGGSEWMVHADHTYEDSGNIMSSVVRGLHTRGGGVELRVHHCDPDRAVARARQQGFEVLADSLDKPHGLREAYIRDGDGYVWVPDVPVDAK